jgi:hypothetical protein
MGEQLVILLDSKNTCTPDAIAIRGGGRVGELVRKWRWELRRRGESLASRVAYRPPRGRDLPPRKTPG